MTDHRISSIDNRSQTAVNKNLEMIKTGNFCRIEIL